MRLFLAAEDSESKGSICSSRSNLGLGGSSIRVAVPVGSIAETKEAEDGRSSISHEDGESCCTGVAGRLRLAEGEDKMERGGDTTGEGAGHSKFPRESQDAEGP